MRAILASHRRRRRAAWLGGAVLVLGGLTVLGINFPNTGHSIPEVFSSAPVTRVPPNPKVDPFTAAERRQVRAVATRFIESAVYRRHVDDSWVIVTPDLRQGMSRKVWAAGAIPVVPYPGEAVAEVRWRVNYSYARTVGMKVAIYPRAGADVSRQVFDIELQNAGTERQPRWLVSLWAPSGGPQLAAAGPGGPPIAVGTSHGSIGSAWLFAPVGLIIGSMMALLGWLALRGWIRSSRANRAHWKSS